MVVLIDRRFNGEQLLLETFFPEMHIERDICKKVISWRFKPPIKKLLVGEPVFFMMFRTSFSTCLLDGNSQVHNGVKIRFFTGCVIYVLL